MNPINTLYISYDGMTDPLGQSQVLPYLCGLSAQGYTVSLISAEKPVQFQSLNTTIERICRENGITWYPIHYTKNPPVLGTLSDIRKISKKAEELHKTKSFQLVHCRSYIPAIVGLALKRKYNIPLLFDMRGFWVDEKIDGKIWNIRNPLYKTIFNYMKQKEKLFFREADTIVSLTKTAIPIIHRIMGPAFLKKHIEVIPCCVDTSHFNPEKIETADVERWKTQLDINDNDFILTYLGSLSTWYLPEDMLLFFKSFQQHLPNAKFLIITTEDSGYFIKKASEMGIKEKAIIFTSSSRKDLPSLLSLCKASVFFIKPAFSKIASSPTKLGELMSMGIPVICNTGIGDTDEIISASGCGVICYSLNETGFNEAALKFLQMMTAKSKEQIRMEAKKYFSLENGVKKYIEIYQQRITQQ